MMTGGHARNVGLMLSSPRCGAKTRSGRPCRSPAVWQKPLPDARRILGIGCATRQSKRTEARFVYAGSAQRTPTGAASIARALETDEG
jgi:hypothetical protein